MTTRIGINGFGRIGRLTFRAINKYHRDELSVVAINGTADVETNAHLFKWDSTYGKYTGTVDVQDDYLIVDSNRVKIFTGYSPEEIPWKDYDVDIVIESTGRFREGPQAAAHLDNGAKKVLISAPAKNEDVTVIPGVNENEYRPDKHYIVSMASCTTNCIAPIVKVLHQSFGVEQGFMTTIHAFTRDQMILDGRHKDLRRARSAITNIVPTSTGASRQVGKIITELEGKIDGIALRVPVSVGSMIDFVADVKRPVSESEVNQTFKRASEGELKHILDYSEERLVSTDYVGNPASAIFDAPSTIVIDDTMVKVLAWYDNEWGYSCRLGDLAVYMAEKGF